MPSETGNLSQVFHEGEVAIQERLGVAEMVAKYGPKNIRDHMPDQHREFFNQLPMMLVGALDDSGQPWATAAFGKPGFAHSPDDKTLVISGGILASDTLGLLTTIGSKLGLLGLESETRRRNRVNATVSETEGGTYALSVDQSFGNCPKYIQRRDMTWREDAEGTGSVTRSSDISSDIKQALESADTFFIASRTADIEGAARNGVDVSHRGGRPGFVKAEGNLISFPDFSGNRFFNTLGNIHLDPRVGLFFPNFQTGDAIFISGRASIIWDQARIDAFKGAERIIDIEVLETVRVEGILPLKGDFIDEWPLLRNTGVWT
jgi:predicted pyridoxine 5'-phosphate oxidase superfamily flavin-nucleotide-binding protein